MRSLGLSGSPLFLGAGVGIISMSSSDSEDDEVKSNLENCIVARLTPEHRDTPKFFPSFPPLRGYTGLGALSQRG